MNPSSYYRQKGRASLSGHWGTAILVCVITGLTISGSGSITQIVDSLQGMGNQGGAMNSIASTATVLQGSGKGLGFFLSAWSMLTFALSGVIELGKCNYFLNLSKGRNPGFFELFGYMGHIIKGIWMNIVKSFYIFLWTLPLAFIGIIAVFFSPGLGIALMCCSTIPASMAIYRYALTPYILSIEPKYGVGDAIAMSKNWTKGHKRRLFFLDLSFFGWSILVLLTLGIGGLWLAPYSEASKAHLIKEILDQNMGHQMGGQQYETPWEPNL